MSTKRPARRVLELLTTVPWAITAEGLETLVAMANREGWDPERIAAAMHGAKPEALAAVSGDLLDGTQAVTVRDGVATIPVLGPLFRYANFFTAWSGAASYDVLATDFAAALAHPDVTAILLEIDSPGGEMNGCGELASSIFAARGVKPVVAYVGGFGCSAAYYLASATDRIVVHQDAIVGSIGVRMALMDTWMRDAAKGVRTVDLVSRQSPKKAMAQADIQGLIDNLASVFVADVSKYRGVTTEAVEADFGQGGVFVGAAAIAAGLADELGTYESVRASLVAPSTPQAAAPVGARTGLVVTGATGSPRAEDSALSPAAEMADPISLVAQESHMDKDTPTGAAAGAPTVDAIAVATAERTRIQGILDLATPGHEALLANCIAEPGCSPGDAALRLRAAEKSVAQAALAARASDEKKAIPAAAASPDASTDSASNEAARILAVHRSLAPTR